MADSDSGAGYAGQQGLTDPNSLFNTLNFIIWQCLGRVSTMKLVQIVAVEAGAVGPVGFVDVHPLVNQVDGLGNSVPHGTIYHLPYSRIQGGKNAVIIDPEVDDIGWAVFADRDSSVIKNTKTQGNPGSKRRFDLADGVYFGGILNGTPDQYIQFKNDGMLMADKNGNKVNMTPGGVEIDDANGNKLVMSATGNKLTGNLEISGNLLVDGTFHSVGIATLDAALNVASIAVSGLLTAASATLGGITFSVGQFIGNVFNISFQGLALSYRTHVHGGVVTGPSNTNGPQ